VRLADYLAEGRRILARPPRLPARPEAGDAATAPSGQTLDADAEALRWFPLPADILGTEPSRSTPEAPADR
ncbi:MAG: hypothetical protein ACHQZR_01575, partial [Candidatus Limnocylindrales bacterium]